MHLSRNYNFLNEIQRGHNKYSCQIYSRLEMYQFCYDCCLLTTLNLLKTNYAKVMNKTHSYLTSLTVYINLKILRMNLLIFYVLTKSFLSVYLLSFHGQITDLIKMKFVIYLKPRDIGSFFILSTRKIRAAQIKYHTCVTESTVITSYINDIAVYLTFLVRQ